jgi:hypothetical protein
MWRKLEPLAFLLALGGLIAIVVVALRSSNENRPETLEPHAANPRYFADGSGRPLYLTGSHTWSNLVDIGTSYPPPRFDFAAYLDLLERYGHNFIRLWTHEQPQWAPAREGPVAYLSPQPWVRSGPGKALDGLPRFDLERFNPAYFQRLRARVLAAEARGIYVSVMLFEGWQLQFSRPPFNWRTHPFNENNNINGIDGDVNGDGRGIEVHTLANRAVTEIQRAYVRKVVDTVSDLDNVLFEIANESGGYSTAWQYSMIDLIKTHQERNGQTRHPVGMTFQYSGGNNATLFRSEADWISPRADSYLVEPPATDGRKVVVLDTDHICGVCPGAAFIWRSFFRGSSTIYMDPLFSNNPVANDPGGVAVYEEARLAMANTLRLAHQIDLAAMEPGPDVSSTGYALVDRGDRYLVYQPDGGPFRVDLRGVDRTLVGRWLNPATGRFGPGTRVSGGAWLGFQPPSEGPAVLFLAAASES